MKPFFALALALAALLSGTSVEAQTLRWASQGDPQTMDPHSQNESMTNMMNGQVYERLTSRDRQLNIVPGLASEWQQVSPLVWRMKLRPNVKFHDGSPFGADDVVYSIERAAADRRRSTTTPRRWHAAQDRRPDRRVPSFRP
jgi:peptide/nickel transport system substrate-binding protein